MDEFIPPKVRKIAYVVYTLLGVALGSFQAGFSAAEVAHPMWLNVAFSVFIYIGTAFGIVAAGNVATKRPGSTEITQAG